MLFSFSKICFLNESREKLCTPRITCPLLLPLKLSPHSYMSSMLRRLTYPIFTVLTPARMACTPHFDSRKLLFFISSANAYPGYVSPSLLPYTIAQSCSPAVCERSARTPLIHRVGIEKRVRVAQLSMHLRANQQYLFSTQCELAIEIHAIDLLRILL